MPRAPRIDVGNEFYHVINRANNRTQIFHNDKEYQHFERLLREAKERIPMRILAYVLMPNHWHLVLHTENDGDLSLFMQWLTLTHTQQYRAKTQTIGHGHLYQGRYKSFLVEKDSYLVQLIRYVERNPHRAKLVQSAEEWRWGSAWRRYYGDTKERGFLDALPIDLPRGYRISLNEKEDDEQLSTIRNSVNRGRPLGAERWVGKKVSQFGLLLTVRSRGRPKNSEKGT